MIKTTQQPPSSVNRLTAHHAEHVGHQTIHQILFVVYLVRQEMLIGHHVGDAQRVGVDE